MPIHDWTRDPLGLFHVFHQSWSIRIMDALNGGNLTNSYYAFAERRVSDSEPDVIAVQTQMPDSGGNTATLAPPTEPRTQMIVRASSEAASYAARANRISVRHPLGQVVAVIELVSPGNKDSRNAIRSFVNKAVTFLQNGVHLLIVDLFPPNAERDPNGVHKLIWDEFTDEPFTLPEENPLTLMSYQSALEYVAHLEFTRVGNPLPDMPLFLANGNHVMLPLEATYMATWNVCPLPLRELVEAAE